MRTTVTLEPDAEAIVRDAMRRKKLSFKQALNDAIRAGSPDRAGREPFATQTRRMGVPSVNLDQALQVSGELEDEELIRKMRLGQ